MVIGIGKVDYMIYSRSGYSELVAAQFPAIKFCGANCKFCSSEEKLPFYPGD
jgi:hypothetical protein